ncbi:hypothetical protein AL755_18330 [Arthrobacter sp. ERGS1:01]|uniref:acyltransferase family protein n=1 Tax=Arthrobacter sp. ERGS1:01 TaxID=1704044 RepID=UPI0006B539D9|nr:acyltransferase family protein [Arthrobacter sp. ERGS1:01]ALE06960.1 hypothetical protein AL755_18330 [Arthrobacter sp. ERGS1:01]
MSLETLATPRVPGRRSAASQPAGTAGKSRKFLPEVQGLRALAVLMVVAYHVWFGRISGGVDIFLLISAFLLTGQFTRRLESGKSLELFKYWAHLFKRLLPLITVTLLATLAATFLFLPQTSWNSIFGQTWASLFYYQNWFLAAESVDYYVQDHSLASPLQHFWSLSIQGQIFILWPLIFAAAALIARRGKLLVRPLLMYMFGTVFVVSLVFSIITTHTNQAFAYFDTRTRLWEFALGSLLALVLPLLKFGRTTRIVLGWLGVAAMLSCGLILQVGQQFPGYMALWPTLAAACVIVAGHTGSSAGADRFLSWKPLVKLGDSSYALYLFHWPVLVIFLIVSGRDHAGIKAGLAIIVVSLLAAILATKWIDTPLRRNKWIEKKRRRAVTVIAVSVALVAAPLAGWQGTLLAEASAAGRQVPSDNPGALTMMTGYVDKVTPGAAVLPTLAGIESDRPDFAEECSGDAVPPTERLRADCTQDGVLDGTETETVMVVGSSHAHHISGAVRAMAMENHWKVVKLWRPGCIFGAEAGKAVESCLKFNDEATDFVLSMKPDRVFTMATVSVMSAPKEALAPGYGQKVRQFTDAGIKVIGVRDNPRFKAGVPACISRYGADAPACNPALSKVMPAVSPLEGFAADNAKFFPVDMTDLICPDGVCRAVIGNVHVYIDNNHVGKTYWNTMAAEFAKRLTAQKGWRA